MVMDLKQKTFFLITGASRGIGQTMAVEVAKKLANDSVIVLIARCKDGLAKTKSTIEIGENGKTLKVLTYSLDLGQATAEQFKNLLQDALKDSSEKADNFQRAFIIHNAGTVGDVTKRAIDVSDTQIWSQFYYMNVFSVISLNSEFYQVFTAVPKLVVNISSKCGIEPFASMSFYCSSKAARDMYFRVLATEESENSVVLNYAPGAIDTDMSRKIQEESINKELATLFKDQRDSKTMLTSKQTTDKFLTILHEQKFKSGDHVDYWD